MQNSSSIATATRTDFLTVLGFNDMSTIVGHFVSEGKKRDSREDEREGQGIKRIINESEKKTEETRIQRKASSHLLAQKSQEPQSECGY